jgi:GLPGLI family protein
MKKILILLSGLVFSLSGNSQEAHSLNPVSGKIIYEEIVKIEIKLEGDAAQFADQMPKEQVSRKVLYFNRDYAIYEPDAKKEESILDQQSGGMQVRIMRGGENDKIYCDLREMKKTEQKEFMTRMFLVEGDLNSSDWKITGNSRIVLGYNCQEAILKDTANVTKAWFTGSIPVSAGPAGFYGLPGLILQIDINDGKRLITAASIDPSLEVTNFLVKPKEGKKVTQEEYRKIVNDKMKEMGHGNGQGTNHVMIRIQD